MAKSYHIDTTPYIRDLKGEIIKVRTPKGIKQDICQTCKRPLDDFDVEDMTIGAAITTALNALGENKGISVADKLDRFQLAVKIHNAHLPVEIGNKEKDLILKCINEVYPSPIILARVDEHIKERKDD